MTTVGAVHGATASTSPDLKRKRHKMKLWAFKLTIQRHDTCMDEVNALVVPMVDREGARGVRELILLYKGAICRAEEAEDLSLKYARELEHRESRTFPSVRDIAMYPHADGSTYPRSNVSRIPGPIERQAARETGYGLPLTQRQKIYSAVDPMPVKGVQIIYCPDCGSGLSIQMPKGQSTDVCNLFCEGCEYRLKVPSQAPEDSFDGWLTYVSGLVRADSESRGATPVYDRSEFYGVPISEPYENQYSTERLDGAQEMAFETHPKECPECGSRMALAPIREGQEPDTVGVECTGFPSSDTGCGYRKVLHREVRPDNS